MDQVRDEKFLFDDSMGYFIEEDLSIYGENENGFLIECNDGDWYISIPIDRINDKIFFEQQQQLRLII